MGEIDRRAIQAAADNQLMDSFVQENEFFIIKCISSVVHRYVTKSDDEWSVALSAFLQAVKSYSIDKGSFMSFAQLVIRRKLIDHIRVQTKHNLEIPVSPSVLDCDNDEEEEDSAMKSVILKYTVQPSDNSLKLEIEAVSQIFSTYGFSFFDLAKCSPKAKKTKKACAQAVAYIVKHSLILSNMKDSKLLPIKLIEKNTNVPQKILERHRKYIIAAAEIITGDYPFLSEYIRFIREELNK